MIRATVDANIVCILVSTKKVSFRNGLTTVKSISGSNELLSFVKKIEIETGFEFEYLPGQEENLFELKNETDKLILGQLFIFDDKNELIFFS